MKCQLMYPKVIAKKKPRKGLNHQRKGTVAALKRRLDALMSEYVRARDKRCVTCGSLENLTCGHLITRGKESVKWDFFNCNTQCKSCNFKHEFQPEHYTMWFINKFGKAKYEELYTASNILAHNKRADYEAIERQLEDAIKNL